MQGNTKRNRNGKGRPIIVCDCGDKGKTPFALLVRVDSYRQLSAVGYDYEFKWKAKEGVLYMETTGRLYGSCPSCDKDFILKVELPRRLKNVRGDDSAFCDAAQGPIQPVSNLDYFCNLDFHNFINEHRDKVTVERFPGQQQRVFVLSR